MRSYLDIPSHHSMSLVYSRYIMKLHQRECAIHNIEHLVEFCGSGGHGYDTDGDEAWPGITIMRGTCESDINWGTWFPCRTLRVGRSV